MKPRESWGSWIGFLMAAAGSAVGLGSLWKFPYVTGENGGGIFVFFYLLFTFIIGAPIFMAELFIGRTSQKSPVLAYAELSSSNKNWKFIGWNCAFTTFLILSFYTVVSGWALNYVLMSLVRFSDGKSASEIKDAFDLLYTSPDINLFWNFLFVGITAAIVYRGIRKGIEFWSKILMPALFIILILLFFYSLTLDGAGKAFKFVFYPNFGKLKPSSLIQALGLACFTLSVGMGVLITYGSYLRKTEDIPRTTAIVSFMDIFVSLMASMIIFPIIFTFNFSPEEGPGLLFKTMPVLFAKLPGTLVISTIFFILVVFAALTSAISVLEVLVATVTDTFLWSRGKASLIVSTAVFILGIPSCYSGSDAGIFKNWTAMYGKNFFSTVDDFSFSWLLPINAIGTAVFTGWIFEKTALKEAFDEGSRWKHLFKPWFFLIKWIVPLGILLIVLQQGGIIDIDAIAERLKR